MWVPKFSGVHVGFGFRALNWCTRNRFKAPTFWAQYLYTGILRRMISLYALRHSASTWTSSTRIKWVYSAVFEWAPRLFFFTFKSSIRHFPISLFPATYSIQSANTSTADHSQEYISRECQPNVAFKVICVFRSLGYVCRPLWVTSRSHGVT